MATYHCKSLQPQVEGEDPVHARQELIPGWDQHALYSATVAQVGAGGLGSEFGQGVVRKGVGRLKIYDPDTVELSNLNRQHFFEQDIYHNKALSLAKNLSRQGHLGTEIWGIPMSIQQAVALNKDVSCYVAVCLPDNNDARVFCAEYFGKLGIPVVFQGISGDAEYGYTFVQQPGGPCIACLFPNIQDPKPRMSCRKVAAAGDIAHMISGPALYAVDSLLMKRTRNWNYRESHLAGFVPDVSRTIEKRTGCPLCAKLEHRSQ